MSKLTDAIGYQEGDTLKLTNQWASITITRIEVGKFYQANFVVSGDADKKRFPAANQAMSYALEQLGVYEKGRVS